MKIFFDNLEALEALSHFKRGRFLLAVMRYAVYREMPDLKGSEKALFVLYKAQVDRDILALEDLTSKKRSAGVLGGRPKKQKKQVLFEKSRENLENREIENRDIENRDIENREGENKQNNASASASPSLPAAPESLSPAAQEREFGEFHWIHLSQQEYQELREEMGESELERVIQYVDTLAQQNHNRNGWKDWALILRRAHRENWGVKKISAPKESKYTPSYDLDEIDQLINGTWNHKDR